MMKSRGSTGVAPGRSGKADRIEGVDSIRCGFALEEPLEIGGRRIANREYTVARVTTGGGISGHSYAYAPGAPLDRAITSELAERLVGENWWDSYRLQEWVLGLESDFPAAVVRRAYGLIDICLWDIKAKVLGRPLWQLLGGYERSIPVILVEGYARRDEDGAGFAERIAGRVNQGFPMIKIAYSGGPEAAEDRLRETRARIPAEAKLIMDAVWAWNDLDDLEDAVRATAKWSPYDLAWLEDPFPASEISAISALRKECVSPIAVGDDLTSLETLRALLDADAVDIVRLDITALGGVGPLRVAMSLASCYGRQVSPHIYPEVHQHFAFAFPGVSYIEVFPIDSPFWCTEKFVRSDLYERLADGRLSAPAEPGVGIEIDWDVVKAHALHERSGLPCTK